MAFFFGRGLHRLPVFLPPLRGWASRLSVRSAALRRCESERRSNHDLFQIYIRFASEKSHRRISRINCQLNTASPRQSHSTIPTCWFPAESLDCFISFLERVFLPCRAVILLSSKGNSAKPNRAELSFWGCLFLILALVNLAVNKLGQSTPKGVNFRTTYSHCLKFTRFRIRRIRASALCMSVCCGYSFVVFCGCIRGQR